MKPKRIFLIVLDSVGAGALPDAADFGDAGTSTIRTISAHPAFSAETMCSLGYGNIEGLSYLGKTALPLAAYGRAAEFSRGKDSTSAGLGLFIVKSIMNLHDEDVTVTSENDVTTFAFMLPEGQGRA